MFKSLSGLAATCRLIFTYKLGTSLGHVAPGEFRRVDKNDWQAKHDSYIGHDRASQWRNVFFFDHNLFAVRPRYFVFLWWHWSYFDINAHVLIAFFFLASVYSVTLVVCWYVWHDAEGGLSRKGIDRPTRLLRFTVFVHLPFSFRSLNLFLLLYHSCLWRAPASCCVIVIRRIFK